MKTTLILLLFFLLPSILVSQELYFPPASGEWETVSTGDLGWCEDSLALLSHYLDTNETKAFLILKDGKIAVEWYFDSFTRDSIWYWASAAKSLNAMLVGIAQEEGFLDIDDPISDYLGAGWTSCSTAEEEAITIRHQISMTTGLDDGVPDSYCTLPACLQYLTEPGDRWAYHNAPYTLLRDVLEEASGLNLNTYFKRRIGDKIGALGLWVRSGYNNLFLSRARDMARYGLLVLGGGRWDGPAVLSDTAFYHDMVHSSQDINPSYGYLWWLNGKGTYMLPGLQIQIPTDLIPAAPDDLFAALGKNDQKIYVVPSQNMVVVRMGNAAETDLLALTSFDNEIWKKISSLECGTTPISDLPNITRSGPVIYPNPTSRDARIYKDVDFQSWTLYDQLGRLIKRSDKPEIPLEKLESGLYYLRLFSENGFLMVPLVKQE